MADNAKNTVVKTFISFHQGGKSARFICEHPKSGDTQIIYVDNGKAKEVEVDQAKKTITYDAAWSESFKPVEFMSGVSVLRIK